GFRKENDAALESYNAALTLFRQVGDKLGEANVHLSLGGLKREEKDLAGARKDFEGALSAYRAIGDQYSEARALYRLGDCFTDEEKYKEAILEYEEAIRLWTAIGLADLAESILKPRLERARKYLE
ncbi:MAG: tetratricopeptide repeat protein, partial [Anaerolineae bacterium]|nr:tetratricopeptide repeat protein [Anaerolineae bacterium]